MEIDSFENISIFSHFFTFLLHTLEEKTLFGNVKMLILGEETNLRFFSKSTSCSQGRFLRIKLYIWCFIHKFLYGDCFRFSIFILSEDFIFEVSKIKSEHWVNVHSEIFIKNHVIFVENLDFDNLFAQYMRTDRFKIKLKPQILDKNKKILKEKHVHVSMFSRVSPASVAHL